MPVPPDPVTGVKGAAVLMIIVVDGTGRLAVRAGAVTARLKVWVAVTPTASVIVTVRTVAAESAVGVPVIAPVPVLKDSPAGSGAEIA